MKKIRVAVLDDHQSIIDGYNYRLSHDSEIEVVGTATYGEELEPLLTRHDVDVLLLDVLVPTSTSNANPYPILYLIPRLMQTYPNLIILVMSMHAQGSLTRATVEAGASGYILKDDQASIRELAAIIRSVAGGGIHFSQQAHTQLLRNWEADGVLTPRQREVLSLAAAYPDLSSAELAGSLGVAQSTVRNLLSGAYLRLGVRSRSAAIAKARKLGLLAPLKHAQADMILLSGRLSVAGVELSVQDDGIGLAASESLDLAGLLAGKHFGLAGMVERAELIDADLQITSIPEQGTNITLSWKPVSAKT